MDTFCRGYVKYFAGVGGRWAVKPAVEGEGAPEECVETRAVLSDNAAATGGLGGTPAGPA